MTRLQELELCIAALKGIEVATDAYGSTEKGVAMMADIATALALRRNPGGRYGGICQQVADAIHRGLLNQEPPPPAP